MFSEVYMENILQFVHWMAFILWVSNPSTRSDAIHAYMGWRICDEDSNKLWERLCYKSGRNSGSYIQSLFPGSEICSACGWVNFHPEQDQNPHRAEFCRRIANINASIVIDRGLAHGITFGDIEFVEGMYAIFTNRFVYTPRSADDSMPTDALLSRLEAGARIAAYSCKDNPLAMVTAQMKTKWLPMVFPEK